MTRKLQVQGQQKMNTKSIVFDPLSYEQAL